MSEKSFYDLDYIIEINEKRLEQYSTAYQKVMERLTHILLIYSGITIFLIPVVEDGVLLKIRSPLFLAFLLIFVGFLVVSVGYTVRLILPRRMVHLGFPRRYYRDYRKYYEAGINDRDKVNDLLRASYIRELQEALEANEKQLNIKEACHSNAMIFALLSVIPYIICLAFHLARFSGNLTSDLEKKSNFVEIEGMRKDKDDTKKIIETTESRDEIPGVDNSLILDSHPIYRKENSTRSYTYDVNGNKVYINK